jgi:hypothetical protein
LNEGRENIMKKKHILILLFIFVFSGVALLGYNPTWAWDPCSNFYSKPCLDLTYHNKPAYIIYYDNYADGIHTYQIVNHPGQGTGKKKPPGISYIAIKTIGAPETDPSGSGLSIEQLFKDCEDAAYDPYNARKINVNVNPNKGDTMTMVGGEAMDSCGFVWSIIGDDCVGGLLPLPLYGGFEPFEKTQKSICDDSGVFAEITLDECGAEPPSIRFTDYSGAGRNFRYFTRDNFWMVGEYIDDTDSPTTEARQYGEFGLEPACIICADPWPIVLRGYTAYFACLDGVDGDCP